MLEQAAEDRVAPDFVGCRRRVASVGARRDRVVQPLMGLILGGIIHLVIVTGLLALIPVSGSNADSAVAVQWFPALVACLAGFRQKFTYELLDSIMKAFGRQPAGSAKV